MGEFELIENENLDKEAELEAMKAEVLAKVQAEKRQKNVAHQKRINSHAIAALTHFGVDIITATKIIEAIAKGQIANVFIKY
jgi:hypothetical protein